MVRKVIQEGPQRLAVAAYYDDQAGAWQEIKDPGIRAALAKQVEAGQMRVVEPGGSG
jgi:hypothetical protein